MTDVAVTMLRLLRLRASLLPPTRQGWARVARQLHRVTLQKRFDMELGVARGDIAAMYQGEIDALRWGVGYGWCCCCC